jgi:hypothetical protein
MGLQTVTVIVAGAWIVVVFVVFAICRAAAHADGQSDRLIAH